MRRIVDLPRDLLSPGRARQVTRQVFDEWGAGADSDPAVDAVLCVSEAVANAVVHGRGSIRLTLTLDGGAAVIAVHDEGPMIPAQRGNPEHGRGLKIIAALPGGFKVIPDPSGHGKTVMFTVPVRVPAGVMS